MWKEQDCERLWNLCRYFTHKMMYLLVLFLQVFSLFFCVCYRWSVETTFEFCRFWMKIVFMFAGLTRFSLSVIIWCVTTVGSLNLKSYLQQTLCF